MSSTSRPKYEGKNFPFIPPSTYRALLCSSSKLPKDLPSVSIISSSFFLIRLSTLSTIPPKLFFLMTLSCCPIQQSPVSPHLTYFALFENVNHLLFYKMFSLPLTQVQQAFSFLLFLLLFSFLQKLSQPIHYKLKSLRTLGGIIFSFYVFFGLIHRHTFTDLLYTYDFQIHALAYFSQFQTLYSTLFCNALEYSTRLQAQHVQNSKFSTLTMLQVLSFLFQ